MNRLESRIETLEARIKAIDDRLLDPAVYSDGSQCRALQHERAAIRSELDPLEEEWARRASET